jgi:hypothetical protein
VSGGGRLIFRVHDLLSVLVVFGDQAGGLGANLGGPEQARALPRSLEWRRQVPDPASSYSTQGKRD